MLWHNVHKRITETEKERVDQVNRFEAEVSV
jgi:hypothetical protein